MFNNSLAILHLFSFVLCSRGFAKGTCDDMHLNNHFGAGDEISERTLTFRANSASC